MSNNYLTSLAGIDEDLIAGAEQKTQETMTKRRLNRKIFMPLVAALLLMSLAIGTTVAALNRHPTVIRDYPIQCDSLVRTPVGGECFFFIDVEEARKANLHRNVEYLLAIELFNENEDSLHDPEIRQTQDEAEYDRLVREGYRLYEATYWFYDGHEATRVERKIIVGYFTEKELVNFKVNHSYGYAFRFAHNGDGSAINVNPEDKLK